MKISIFCFLFLAICADSWAQLTCTNCTVTVNGAILEGTLASPATILTTSGTTFTGNIALNGDCQFTVAGTGNYTLSGQITGEGSLTFVADWTENAAGVTLAGENPNTYTGLTTIKTGFVVCHKSAGVPAVPHDLKISAPAGGNDAKIWFRSNNQLGNGTTVVDFTGTGNKSTFYLNGTIQTIAGIKADNDKADVQNNGSNNSRPIGWAPDDLNRRDWDLSAGEININAAGNTGNSHIFGGGGTIYRGYFGELPPFYYPPELIVNLTGGTQIIQNPVNSKQVILVPASGATLELNTTTNALYQLGGAGRDAITIKGAGTIKKTGPGTIAMAHARVLKPGGKIWVSGGTLRNEGTTLYTHTTGSNKAVLEVDVPNESNRNPTFDIYGNHSIFGGLTGGGWVQNNWGPSSGGGYNYLTLNLNNTETSIFNGIIRDNSSTNQVAAGAGNGGISLKKEGNGIQVLTKANLYTGTTTVSAGTLKLYGDGQLGKMNAGTYTGTYGGALEIANVSEAASQATFEHNGTHPQVFNGPITNTGVGETKGIFLQSGTGKSIINGVNVFTGQVNVTGGFLGGSGSLKNAAGVTVGANSSIGGGDGVVGSTLTVTGLSLAATSKLLVTSRSETDNTPGLVDVKERGTDNQGTITVDGVFTVDVLSTNLVSGRIIKCTNDVANNPPLPVIGQNNTGKRVTFRWEADGLYMDIVTVERGLACNNCSFNSATGAGTITGTQASPALILTSPETPFTGTITLTGDCSFTVIGSGTYTLSGQITGNHSLTLDAPGSGSDGFGYAAGLTFAGAHANSYGNTTINSGYIICNKSPGVSAIPGNIKLAGSSIQSHLWCLADNQLSENTVVDFTGTRRHSYFELNGTAQTIAGLVANTDGAVVDNYWVNTFHPAGMTDAQVSANAATLYIKAGSGSYTFGGGGTIRKGGGSAAALTVYVMSGTQIIQNPNNQINNVTLASAAGATPEAILEFNATANCILGTGITFRGGGTIKKTGAGAIATDGATYLKAAGQIWVSEGEWKNHNANNNYTSGTESNEATLQLDAPSTIFDLMSAASTFGGLTGGGWVRNNWGGGDGYTDLTVNQNDTVTPATFAGIIQNNSTNASVNGSGAGTGGIRLKKEGNGIQVLTGANTYTGSTTVSAGTLKLGEGGQLGEGTYGGALEISNVSMVASQATFEHAGTQAQIFTGNITNTGGGGTKGIFLQSGSGKSIINGAEAKSFSGQVNITAGFLGGSGSLKNAIAVTVGASGSIGGGNGESGEGNTLTVPALSFAAGSKLIVTAMPNSAPSLVKVETSAGVPAAVTTATAGFTVDIVGINLASGYILRCANGANLPVPTLGQHSFTAGVPLPSFRWDAQGLYMETPRGLSCNNCSFGSGSGAKTGTPQNPVLILSSPGTFTGNIALNGDCQFTVTGTGNYTLSGQITGEGSLTFVADENDWTGNAAGVTLAGENPNTYTGLTTIKTGFVVCHKSTGVPAVPHDLKISAPAGGNDAKIWFRSNNQLGNGTTVVDFTGTGNKSTFYLNGTIQTVAGIKADNDKVDVQNNGSNNSRPIGWAPDDLNRRDWDLSAGEINIDAAGNTGNSHIFGGGGTIYRGYFGELPPSYYPPELIVNVTGGTQIIQNPANSKQLILVPAFGATLELNTTTNALYQLGGSGRDAITIKGAGTIKKTGPGTIAMAHARVLKPGGKIWVSGGTLRNEGTTLYTHTTGNNKAVLEVDAPNESNHNPTFDIYGNHSIFGGLTGGGWVQNNWGPLSSGGYNYLTLNRNNTETSIFNGIIRDNSSTNQVALGAGNGGISLKKEGTGIQVLTGANRYTGSTTVSAGTLKLHGDGQLGKMNAGTYTGTYGGVLEIANVPEEASQATFEHNGTQTQVFNGPITNTGVGETKGIFLQSGSGKSIINGVNAFTGQVNVTAGFLGGSGSLKNAAGVTVGADGSIGGGNGAALGGDMLTVSGLSFAAGSKLTVTAMSNGAPSLVKVVTSAGAPGTVTATGGFMVDVVGAISKSGYVLKCANGASLPLPTLSFTAVPLPSFRWDEQGLYMEAPRGLTCNNCTFGSGNGTTGTPQNPALMLSSPGTFTGDITLTGDCQFIVTGIGNYTLSGQITGTGSLTYVANTFDMVYHEGLPSGEGNSAGVTLTGSNPNTYTGLTTIQSGYLICTKDNNVAAVPHDLKISARSDGPAARIWFYNGNNQLGGGTTVVDFTDTGNTSYFHLNGSTQTIAGFKANNDKVTVHNVPVNRHRPIVAGWAPIYLSFRPHGVININAIGNNSHTFGGEGSILRGYFGTYTQPSDLTINVNSGTQVIENPNVKQVRLESTEEGTLELKTTNDALYQLGGAGRDAVSLKGNGIVKKTGLGTIAMSHTPVLKSGGKIWVFGGTLRNEGTTIYTLDTARNRAVLEVDTPNESNYNPTFDIWGNNSIFGGLTGGGRVQNNWGASTDGGYNYLTLNLKNAQTSIFSGIIRDNSSTSQVAAGHGNGGIALKKEGTGIQVLTGSNLYTGTTTVSAGTLKLQGDGRLGTMNAGTYTGTYGGVLEIANVSEEASQATFEHKGSQIQVFTGNITSTGEGDTKGIFLQSGNGKSIINGAEAKSFSGQVNVTAGFLGGSGDLRNATSVTVGEQGSIGGSDRVAVNGDTLTVSNLTFAAATSKLIVITSASRPGLSLVKVKTSGSDDSGTITAEHGFTVDITGDNLVSGYIIKCSNGLNLSLPTLENKTRKGVLLSWDNKGLWMQVITVGEIIIRARSVCPKGSTPGNPRITVDVTYTNESDLPPATGAAPEFTLSEAKAKSGLIEVTRAGKVITAVFDGANPTHDDLPYRIIYYDHKNGVMTAAAQINRQPTLSASTGGNLAYIGTPLILQAVGNGVTISSENTTIATVGNTTETLSARATPKTTGRVNFLATDQDGCKSEYLSVEVKVPPLEIPIVSSVSFSVYPIPAQDRLTILNDDGDLQHITICDISGKTVMSEAVNGRKAILSITHFTNGIYLLTVTDSKGVKRMKISKN